MTDLHGGIANIKKKTPVPNYSLFQSQPEPPSRFQRNIDIKYEVPEYNTKAGKLPL